MASVTSGANEPKYMDRTAPRPANPHSKSTPFTRRTAGSGGMRVDVPNLPATTWQNKRGLRLRRVAARMAVEHRCKRLLLLAGGLRRHRDFIFRECGVSEQFLQFAQALHIAAPNPVLFAIADDSRLAPVKIELDCRPRLVCRAARARPRWALMNPVAVNQCDAAATCAKRRPFASRIDPLDFLIAESSGGGRQAEIARKTRTTRADVVAVRTGNVHEWPARVVDVHQVYKNLQGVRFVVVLVKITGVQRPIMREISNQGDAVQRGNIAQEIRCDPQNAFVERDINRFRNIYERVPQSNHFLGCGKLLIRKALQTRAFAGLDGIRARAIDRQIPKQCVGSRVNTIDQSA